MNLLTALEIYYNYPENISITAAQHISGRWCSFMYRLKEGFVHKLMLSYDITGEGGGFETDKEALDAMHNVAKQCIDYFQNKKKEKESDASISI